jgi:hypothetical protein
MTKQANVQPAGPAVGWAIREVRVRAGLVLSRLVATIDAWARLRGATALYEELCKLSDAELERRGLPRVELYHRVFGGLADKTGLRLDPPAAGRAPSARDRTV